MQELTEFKKTTSIEIPEEWNTDEIQNHSKITTGTKNTQDKIEGGRYPFFVRSQKVERINTYSFDGEAVLTAGDGVGTGKVFHYINGKFDFHQRVYNISNFTDDLNGYFFYLYFSNYFLPRIRSMSAKSSVDSVRMDMIAKMLIPIPPIKEQQKIASILSKANELIQKTDQVIEQTQKLKKGLMQRLLTKGIGHTKFKKVPTVFGNVIEIPQEWKVDYLSNQISFLGGFAFSSSNYRTDGIQLLRQGNLFNKKLRLDKDPVYLPSEFLTEYKRYVLRPEDIVISLTGTMGKRDYGFVVKIPLHSPPLLLNQRIAKVILLSETEMDKDYLASAMNSLYFQEQFYRLEGGTKQANISLDKISKIQIFIPEKIEQKKIVSNLSIIDLAIENNIKCRKHLQILKQGLFQKLLTGKIRVRV